MSRRSRPAATHRVPLGAERGRRLYRIHQRRSPPLCSRLRATGTLLPRWPMDQPIGLDARLHSQPDGAYKIFIILRARYARPIRPDLAYAVYPPGRPTQESAIHRPRRHCARQFRRYRLFGKPQWKVNNCTTPAPARPFVVPARYQTRMWHSRGLDREPYLLSIPVTGASNIWRADIAPPNLTISAKPVQVTSGEATETQPFASAREASRLPGSHITRIFGRPSTPNEGKLTGQPKRWTRDREST